MYKGTSIYTDISICIYALWLCFFFLFNANENTIFQTVNPSQIQGAKISKLFYSEGWPRQ